MTIVLMLKDPIAKESPLKNSSNFMLFPFLQSYFPIGGYDGQSWEILWPQKLVY